MSALLQEENNGRNEEGGAAKTARSPGKASSQNGNFRTLTDKLVADYEAQRGFKPTWKAKDWKNLNDLRKRTDDKEILRRFQIFLQSDTRFIREKGWALATFVGDFDAYSKTPVRSGTNGTGDGKRGGMASTLKKIPPKQGVSI